jgi:hypothetical protein
MVCSSSPVRRRRAGCQPDDAELRQGPPVEVLFRLDQEGRYALLFGHLGEPPGVGAVAAADHHHRLHSPGEIPHLLVARPRRIADGVDDDE